MNMQSPTLKLLAIACLLAATQARAEDVTFTGFAHGSETVNFQLTYPDASQNRSGSTSAGGFLTVLNGGAAFESYCVDLYQFISFGTTYHDYTLPGTTHAFTNPTDYADLSKLYARAGVVDTSVKEAAFQIAAWEIAFDTSTVYTITSLSDGTATFTGGTADSSGALTLATTWLTSLDSAGPGPGIAVLQSPGEQDVMTPVPEPETYALMLAGLGALGFAARRRREA
jgi:hypothetical protein